MRPKCSVYIAVSLDGYIARDDGGLDWLGSVQLEGEDYGYAEFFASIDALLVGRGTWDAVAGFEAWPWAGKRVVVLTGRPLEAAHGEEVAHGALTPILERLGADGVRHVYVDGGVVIRKALQEGVIDELTLSVVPRVLGSGIRLFDRGLPEVPLRLVSSRSWSSGLVQLRYAV